MADYFPIPDTMVDPDAPLLSDLAYAWRDNPLAIAEGSSGAPKVQGAALGGVFNGSGTFSGTTSVPFLNIGRISTLNIDLLLRVTGFSPVLRVAFSNNGGTSWGSNTDILFINRLSTTTRASVVFNLSSSQWFVTGVNYDTSSFSPVGFAENTGTISSIPENPNSIRISSANNAVGGRFKLYTFGGY